MLADKPSTRRRGLVAGCCGLLALLLATPVALWWTWRPVRAMAPGWAGLSCDAAADVCIDNPARLAEARALKAEALAFVAAWAGPFHATPRMVFCATVTCDRAFGFRGNAAYNVGAQALVVSSRGWAAHFVRHELIHCVQVERIGGFRMMLRTPTWLIEGMAYSVSQDPRRPLPEPLEGFRRQYEAWAARVPAAALWSRAEAL